MNNRVTLQTAIPFRKSPLNDPQGATYTDLTLKNILEISRFRFEEYKIIFLTLPFQITREKTQNVPFVACVLFHITQAGYQHFVSYHGAKISADERKLTYFHVHFHAMRTRFITDQFTPGSLCSFVGMVSSNVTPHWCRGQNTNPTYYQVCVCVCVCVWGGGGRGFTCNT